MNEFKSSDKCPDCNQVSIHPHSRYQIKSGETRQLYYCDHCQRCFSETRDTALFGLHTVLSRIILILDSLTEGMAINALCRVFLVSKNSIYRWQERLSSLKETLLLYALCHHFLQQVVEGDELYTKIKKTLILPHPKAGQLF